MYTKNQILTEIYKSDELAKCLLLVKKESIREDIKQEVFLSLLHKQDEFIIDLYNRGKIKAYISSCIFNEIYSPRSTTRKKYGKESSIFADTVALENIVITEFKKEINLIEEKAIDLFINLPKDNLYKKIFISLCKYGSYRKLSNATGIPHTSLKDMITNLKKQIKSEL